MSVSGTETTLRRSTRDRTPSKRNEQYALSRQGAAVRRENYERGQTVKRQREEAAAGSESDGGQPKAKITRTVKPSDPDGSRASQAAKPPQNDPKGKGKGKERAPPATMGGRVLSPINETEPFPEHPGPRPLSTGDSIEDGVVIEEWTRQRLIWYLTVRDNRPIASNTDYDDLKRFLGADGGWNSGDETLDKNVLKPRQPKKNKSAPHGGTQPGQFDQEPPRRNPLKVQTLPPLEQTTLRPQVQGARPSQASTSGAEKKRKEVGGSGQVDIAKRKRTQPPSKPNPAPKSVSKTTQKSHPKSGGLVIQTSNVAQIQNTRTNNQPAEHAKPLPPKSGSSHKQSLGASSGAQSTSKPPVGRSKNQAVQPPAQPSNMERQPRVPLNTQTSGASNIRNNQASSSRYSAPEHRQPSEKQQATVQSKTATSSKAIRPPQKVQMASKSHPPPTSEQNRTVSVSPSTASASAPAAPQARGPPSTASRNRLPLPQNVRAQEDNVAADPPAQEEAPEGYLGDEDEAEGVIVNTKIQGSGRGRVKHYKGVEKSLLKTAGCTYQAIMLVEGMYESDPDTLLLRRRKAWKMACDHYEVDTADYPLTESHIQSMSDRLVSWRGRASKGIADDVAYLFFGQETSTMTPEQLNRHIEDLKDGKLHTKAGSRQGRGYFQHEILQICMNKMVFRDRKDLGVRYIDLFREPTVELICFFCTIIQYLVEKRATNAPANEKLEYEAQRRAYLTHLGSHEAWLKRNGKQDPKGGRWGLVQKQLFLRAFKHSRASAADVSGIDRHMLQADQLESDDPDDEELAAWESEMAALELPFPFNDKARRDRSNPGDCDGNVEGDPDGDSNPDDNGNGDGGYDGEDDSDGVGQEARDHGNANEDEGGAWDQDQEFNVGQYPSGINEDRDEGESVAGGGGNVPSDDELVDPQQLMRDANYVANPSLSDDDWFAVGREERDTWTEGDPGIDIGSGAEEPAEYDEGEGGELEQEGQVEDWPRDGQDAPNADLSSDYGDDYVRRQHKYASQQEDEDEDEDEDGNEPDE